MIHTALHIIFFLFYFYCALSVLYLALFSFSGKKLYKNKFQKSAESETKKRIAIFVPAYKEDDIILSTSYNLIQLDYPASSYDIYIIADSFKPETIKELEKLPIHVLNVSFPKSTKTKSLNEAFNRIKKEYDIALICDADNLLKKDFLKKIDTAFANGAVAVQGRRVAKNLDSSFAILDSCSEEIGNHIFRKGANGLGLSSSIIGSGMAYDYNMIKDELKEINAIGGFDKILQLKLVEKGIKIYYLHDALIFDEKVDSPDTFKRQRRRWVSSQFIYLKKFFTSGFYYLLKGNVNYFNLAVINNILLPRSFLFIILPVLTLCAFFINASMGISMIIMLVLFFISLLMAIPTELVNKNLLKAVLSLPNAIIIMIGTLFQIHKANKSFIHTKHTKTEVSNTLLNDIK